MRLGRPSCFMPLFTRRCSKTSLCTSVCSFLSSLLNAKFLSFVWITFLARHNQCQITTRQQLDKRLKKSHKCVNEKLLFYNSECWMIHKKSSDSFINIVCVYKHRVTHQANEDCLCRCSYATWPVFPTTPQRMTAMSKWQQGTERRKKGHLGRILCCTTLLI